MATEFSLEGGRAVAEALKQLPQKYVRRGLAQAFRAGAKVVADEAKNQLRQRGAVNTGELLKGIRVASSSLNTIRRSGAIAQIGVVKPHSRRAHLTEYGTGPRRQKNGRYTGRSPAKPFLRPALDIKGAAAIQVIANMTAENIKIIAGQLSAGQKVSLRRRKK